MNQSATASGEAAAGSVARNRAAIRLGVRVGRRCSAGGVATSQARQSHSRLPESLRERSRPESWRAGAGERKERRWQNAKLIVKRLFEEPWTGQLRRDRRVRLPGLRRPRPGRARADPRPGGRASESSRSTSRASRAARSRSTTRSPRATRSRPAGRVAARTRASSPGIAPTGKDVTVSGLTISRFEGGKVVEEWTTWDTLGMLVQLGAIPEPARA